MIQPIQRGAALLHDIASTQLPYGQVAIWWLGQSGYAIKTASTLFYVDLYLSEHLTAKYMDTNKPHIRMTEAPLQGNDLKNVDFIFASHKHSDHLDPATLPDIFKNSPDAKLVLPQAIVDHAVNLGLPHERLIPMRGDESKGEGGLRTHQSVLEQQDRFAAPLKPAPTFMVHAIPSSHPELDYTDKSGYPFLGFVFEADGVRLYHSGDTVVYEGLAERLKPFALDIVFLPINGTDERRNALHVPPNMNLHEAIGLAKAVKATLLIPHHYDMFTFNTVDVEVFKAAADAAQQPYRVLECGEKFVYP